MTTIGVDARRLTLRAHLGANKHADALGTFYVALFRGDPFGSGVEPTSAGGYARKAMTNDVTLWGTIAAGQVSVTSQTDVVFAAATGLYSITNALDYWAVYDNASGGNLWYAGSLNPTITITGAGDQPRIPLGTWQMNAAG
jgi:hypothetical protein